MLSENDRPMKEWISKRENTSPDIVNEVITTMATMGQCVLRNILAKVKEAMWYAVIADEATDVAHNEMMCISVRWVDVHYSIHEDMFGLVQLPDTKSATLFSVIKDVLIRCTLPLSVCRGQACKYERNPKWRTSTSEERMQSCFVRPLLSPQFKPVCTRNVKKCRSYS